MYAMVQSLIEQREFEPIYVNQKQDEVWLQKYSRKNTTIIRFIQKGFNWKNELKTDMARTFNRYEALKQFIFGKNVVIHNIYVSTHPPVDSWEMLKQPAHYKKKKTVSQHMYYIDDLDGGEEMNRLSKNLKIESRFHIPPIAVVDQEIAVHTYRTEIALMLKKQQKEIKSILFYGKPKFVYALIVLNILYFFWIEFNGGSTDTETLIQYGANYNPAIMEGEWWRLGTSMFMHIGLMHLGMNMLALYYLGSAVEQIFGSKRFMATYMIAGIGAGIASFSFTSSISAGASGAIFGMFGVLLYFGMIHKKLFLQTMGMSIVFILGINLVFGFMVPMIDNSAHVGGLIAGFIAASIIQLPSQKNHWIRLLGIGICIVSIIGLLWFGFENEENKVLYELSEIEELQIDKEFDTVIDRTTSLLDQSDIHVPQLLFQRSYAYIMLYNYEAALEDLEAVIELEDTMIPEAYYNAALVYLELNDIELAKERVEKAYDLQPENKDIKKLYEKIQKY